MQTILFSLIAFAFFMLYNTSQKVKYDKTCALTHWVRSHIKQSKIIACGILLISLILENIKEGIGVGSLTFFIYFMFIASAILTLYPMLALKTKHIVSIVSIGLFVEYIIF